MPTFYEVEGEYKNIQCRYNHKTYELRTFVQLTLEEATEVVWTLLEQGLDVEAIVKRYNQMENWE